MEQTKCSELIRKIRLLLCISQKTFAEKIEISRYAVCSYEQSKRHPSYPTLRRIIEAAKEVGLKVTAIDFDLPLNRKPRKSKENLA